MKFLVVYNSVTGFTEKYAKIVVDKVGCESVCFKDFVKMDILNYDYIVFGSRLFAGKIDKFDKFNKFIAKNNINNYAIFVTGATPNEAVDIINDMWKSNLNNNNIPHFYMQSGICLEKLPFMEKCMIKVASFIMRKKNNKSDSDKGFEDAISKSFDISNEKYVLPLIEHLNQIKKK